jgi:hypothetical protein
MYRSTTELVILLAIFVNDGLIASSSRTYTDPILHEMNDVFQIRVDEPDTFIGLHITRNRASKSIFLNQTRYVECFFAKYGYSDIHLVHVPTDPTARLSLHMDHDKHPDAIPNSNFPFCALLGSTAFPTLRTHPNIAFAVSNVARFTHQPTPSHCTTLKKILCYLQGTKEYGISFGPSTHPHCLAAYCDANYAMDLEDRKSQSGALLKVNNGPVVWLSRKQPCIASSTTKAEYLAAHVATKELLWKRCLLNELGFLQQNPILLYSNNQPAICLVCNPEQHQHTKHIDVPYHVIREHQANREIEITYVPTQHQLADIFIKALPSA